MAEDFEAGINSWWNTARTSSSSSSYDGSPAIAAASVSCSASISDAGIIEPQPLSGPLVDSSLQISGFNMDWNQSLIRSNTSGRAEPSFHAMLQEPLEYTPIEFGHHHHQGHIGVQETSNHQFSHDHHQQQQQQQQPPGFPMMLQGLFEPETKSQQPVFDQRSLNYQQAAPMAMMGTTSGYEASSNDSLAQFSQFLRSSPPKQQQSSNQLQFTNTAAFWNASATAYPSTAVPVQFSAHSFEQKPSCSSLTTKSNSEAASKKSGSGSSSNSEPALKKTRVETPSPLPTFKVRKEKLGDRITALQQLVSPFGKTDTASVLHEAIEYIKFLHEQVSVLSTPYMKNGHPMQHQQSSGKSTDGESPKQDLRSRGLCLVPIESTYPVASETTADFWTPTFGGTYR